MQIEELSSKGLKREFKVTVALADISEKVDAQLNELKSKIKLPGFRPGKVPTALLKKQYGESVMGQVLEELVNETTEKLFKEKEIKPAMRPNVEVLDFGDDKDLAYKVEVEVLPEITTPDFSKIKLERLVVKADEKDIDKAVEDLASQQKRFDKAAKTYAAKTGDAVFIDFLGTFDGVPFDGGAGQDFQLELGSGQFIPGFEGQLIGAKAGDEVEVQVSFPDDYGSDDMAGKAASFAVTVHEIRKPGKVKIDDQLAVDLGMENLEGLRNALADRLAMETEGASRALIKRRLLDELEDICDFDAPQGMVDLEFQEIWARIQQDAVTAGEAKLEDFEGKDGPEDKKERKEFEEIATRRVRLGLLLSEVGQQNDVQIAQEEINRALMQEAQKYPGQEKEVLDYFKGNENAMAQLRAPIYEEKVCDLIIAKTSIKDKGVTREVLEQALRDLESDESGTPKTKKKPKSKQKQEKLKKEAKKATSKKAPGGKSAVKKTPAKKAAKKK
jgi:trigger factor